MVNLNKRRYFLIVMGCSLVCDFLEILPTLEDVYNIYYSERLKRLEEKTNMKLI